MLNYFKKRPGKVVSRSKQEEEYSNSRSRGTWRDGPFRKTVVEVNEGGSTESESLQTGFLFKRNSLQSTSSFCDEILAQADTEVDATDSVGSCGASVGSYSLASDDDIFQYKSRLAMSLSSIVSEPNCLTYFVQYLDARSALPPLKFYLDTENFKTAAITQLEKNQQNLALVPTESLSSCTDDNTDPNLFACENGSGVTNLEEDKNRVPELKNYYDLSMRQPLTDDEKSQIYAETNKQIYQCNESTRNNNINKSSIHCSDENGQFGDCVESAALNCRSCTENSVSPASVKDAIAIYQKYLIADASQFVSIPVTILSQISLLLCKRTEIVQNTCTQNPTATEVVPTIPATCFAEAQRFVMEELERKYLNDFLQSPFYGKYCVELVENGQPELSIYDILYSEATLFFFMEFLEQHDERECLNFWTAAINFRKSYESLEEEPEKNKSQIGSTVSEAQTDAMIIYEKFFSLQSDDRLWLSDRLRSRVEERICAKSRIAYCFDLPLQLVAKYLERKYFQDFLKSQLFENYLKELKLKLREVNDAATSKASATSSILTIGVFRKSLHRKTLSDCSEGNRHEVIKQNTLLAMDGNKMPQTRIKRIQQTSTSDLHIDSRQLTNPNLLWRRSYSSDSGAIKFGHINELGRYERDFDSIDSVGNEVTSGNKNNWSLNLSGNKIKNAMRKLVNLPEEKVQEEIAWQVAEMIVKDVTNVTLRKEQMNSKTTVGSSDKNISCETL